MESIAESFEVQHGISVVRNYGGSGALLAQASLSHCDFYLPADESYLSTNMARDVIQEQIELFSMSAVFVCQAEDHRWAGKETRDLLKEVKTMSLGDQSTAIGLYTEKLLKEQQLWSLELEQKTIRKPSVTSALNDVALEAADVSIAWRPLVHHRDDLKILNAASLGGESVGVSLGKMKGIKQKENASLFLNFITREGKEIFAKYGFEVH